MIFWRILYWLAVIMYMCVVLLVALIAVGIAYWIIRKILHRDDK